MTSLPTTLKTGIKDVGNKNKFYVLLLFVLSPLLSLFLVIKNHKSAWAKNIVWLSIAFYAYHMIPANEGVDFLSYIERFNYYKFSDYTIEEFIISLYSEESRTLDIIEPLLSYLLSKITSNHRILLLSYGFIYGYFYSRNVWRFLSHLKGKTKNRTTVILFLLLVTIGIWEINGFRFWCGAHIFIYATYNFIILRRTNGLIFLILAPLMHIGFLLPSLITILYRFIKIPTIILFPTFLFTFFLVELDLEIIRNFIDDYGPSFMQKKLTDYTSEAYIESVGEKFDNYSIPYHISKYLSMFIRLSFIFILYLNRKAIKDESIYILVNFYLFYGIFANLISQIPSGGRYGTIGSFILYGITMIFIQNNTQFKLKNILPLLYPVILLLVVYQIRIMGFYTFSIHHIINNPIFSPFIY